MSEQQSSVLQSLLDACGDLSRLTEILATLPAPDRVDSYSGPDSSADLIQPESASDVVAEAFKNIIIDSVSALPASSEDAAQLTSESTIDDINNTAAAHQPSRSDSRLGILSTTLCEACRLGHVEVIQALLAAGADVNSAGSSHDQSTDTIAPDMTIRVKRDHTPLYWASECGHAGAVRALLEAGADVNAACAVTRATALTAACAAGHAAVVELLLEHGADTSVASVAEVRREFENVHVLSRWDPSISSKYLEFSMNNSVALRPNSLGWFSASLLHVPKDGDSIFCLTMIIQRFSKIDTAISVGVAREGFRFDQSNGFGPSRHSWGLIENRELYNSELFSDRKCVESFRSLREGDLFSIVYDRSIGKAWLIVAHTSVQSVKDVDNPDSIISKLKSELCHEFNLHQPGERPDLVFGATYSDGCEIRILNATPIVGAKSPLTVENDQIGVPMTSACWSGHANCVRVLLDKTGSSVNQGDEKGQTGLHIACMRGHLSVTKLLLDRGANTNQADNSDWENTPLTVACLNGHAECVRELLDRDGVSVNQTNKDGQTGLLLASANGQSVVVELLLERGADINQVDSVGFSPLAVACCRGHADCVNLLLDRGGASLNETFKFKYTGLLLACRYGRAAVVSSLLKRKDVSVNQSNNDGETGLLLACQSEHTLIAELLLEHDADLNQADSTEEGNTPLTTACQKSSLGCVRLLLDRGGVSVNQSNKDGETGLLFSCSNDQVAVADLLLDRGADVNQAEISKQGNTPLTRASGNGQLDCVRVLLDRGSVSVNQANKEGHTGLMRACIGGHASVVEFLLQRGANANQSDTTSWGYTPLIKASEKGHLECVRLLLDRADVQVNQTNKDGLTGLQLACRGGHTPVVELLLDRGADIDQADLTPDGQTPFIEACLAGKLECVRLLLSDKNTSVNQTNKKGHTGLACAYKNEKKHIVRALIEKGADLSELESLCKDRTVFQYVFDLQLPSELVYVKLQSSVESICAGALAKTSFELQNMRQYTSSWVQNFSTLRYNIPICTIEDANSPERFIMYECTLASDGPTRFGICSSLSMGGIFKKDNGVGENDKSCGIDGSSGCVWYNGTHEISGGFKWQVGSVIGVLIDSFRHSVFFYHNGERIKTPDIDISSIFANGSVFASLSIVWKQSSSLNFGHEPFKYPIKFIENVSILSIFQYHELKCGQTGTTLSLPKNMDIFDPMIEAWTAITRSSGLLKPDRLYDWSWLVNAAGTKPEQALPLIKSVLADNSNGIEKLLFFEDEAGRKVVDAASADCKLLFQSYLYFLGKFEIKKGRPEHVSQTCSVLFSVNHSASNSLVALKFMREKSQYLKELECRAHLDARFIVPVIESYDGDSNTTFVEQMKRRGLGDYNYLLVLPQCSRGLQAILTHEHICGSDWKAIRSVFEDIVTAVDYLHSKHKIHGDIKPLNIMRRDDGRIVLIDMDASCAIGAACGEKFSTAYLPPEMIHRGSDDSTEFMIRSYPVPKESPYSYQPLIASYSYDMWSLGCVLFHLCTGETLWQTNSEDNLTNTEDLVRLKQWSSKFKTSKLQRISDLAARNLVDLLLSKEPESRPTAARVLEHPFLTGKQVARLPGQEAEFDVFISYRVNPDKDIALKLYEALKNQGLKVWLDKIELLPGQNWEEGFCNGLVKSRNFLPLLSREGINNGGDERRNFSKLTEQSPCDNVFLEYRLCLELKARGLIEGIYPIMIGDRNRELSHGEYTFRPDPITRNPPSHPICPKVRVSAVESKLANHLETLGLGSIVLGDDRATVDAVMISLMMFQGEFLIGAVDESISQIVAKFTTKGLKHTLSEPSGSIAGGLIADSGRFKVAASYEAEPVKQLVKSDIDSDVQKLRHTIACQRDLIYFLFIIFGLIVSLRLI